MKKLLFAIATAIASQSAYPLEEYELHNEHATSINAQDLHNQTFKREQFEHQEQQYHEHAKPDPYAQIDILKDNAQQWHASMTDAQNIVKASSHLRWKRYTDTGELEITDPYKSLNIPRNATEQEIEQSYKKAVKKYRPDKLANLSEEERTAGEKKLKEISNAYTLLTTPELKESYTLFRKMNKRFKGSNAEFDHVVPATLEHATNMITAIDEHLQKMKDGKTKHEDTEKLNATLKEEFLQLKNALEITKGSVQLDGESLQSQIRNWSKSMLDQIRTIQEDLTPQATSQEQLEDAFTQAQERTDDAYTNWLYEDKQNVTYPVHSNNRTPLQEALEAGSPQMAENIITAAKSQGISMKKLVAPIKEEYARLLAQGKTREAEYLEAKVYKINNNDLTNTFYK